MAVFRDETATHASGELSRAPRGRQRWWALGLIALYGTFLVCTNPLVTVFDDEAGFVLVAHENITESLAAFAAGNPRHMHPPLSDIVLHLWLRAAGESLGLVRLPFIVCYCLSLWIVSETAGYLWRKRRTALLIGIAWPLGYFMGRPAGWYSLTVLEIASLTWLYCRWSVTTRTRDLVWFGVSALLLIYTNYLGWVFLAVLCVDLLATGKQRLRGPFVTVIALLVIAFVPLVWAFSPLVYSAIALPEQSKLETILQGAYLADALMSSEIVAPWTWLGMIAVVAEIGLFWLCIKRRESRWVLLWLAAAFILSMFAGVLTGKRIVVFGPWLLLLLTRAVSLPNSAKAITLVGLIFGIGWLGIATGGYPGTYRYIEPWRDVTTEVVKISRPGDLIISSHSSFYFYLSYVSHWKGTQDYQAGPFVAAGRTLSRLEQWKRPLSTPPRMIYVRSNTMPWDPESEGKLLEYAAKNFRLTKEMRFMQDTGATIKHRFFPNVHQPDWRIEIQVWSRRGA